MLHDIFSEFIEKCQNRHAKFMNAVHKDGSWCFPLPSFTQGSDPFVFILGDNATGKSLYAHVFEQLCRKNGYPVRSASMRNRTSGQFGQRLIFGDESQESTGYNSYLSMTKLLKSMAQDDKPTVGVLDEPSIGLSVNYTKGLCRKIVELSSDIVSQHLILISTHDRALVQWFISHTNPSFIGVDGLSVEEWLVDNEERDPEDMVSRGSRIRSAVRQILENRSQSISPKM